MHNADNSIWIMLRGLGREQRHWEGFPPYFSERMGGVTLVLPDLPGTGIHWRETSPMQIREMVEFVRADIGVHLFNRPMYILGLSLGAMVALEWARRYPRECAGVVLMNTSMRGLCPFYQRLRPGGYGLLLRALWPGKSLLERERLIFNLTSRLNQDPEKVVDNWVRYAGEQPVTRINVLRQLVAAMRYKIPHGRPEVPLLVLRGLADRMVDPRCSERLAQRWELPMQSHIRAGHDLTLDDADWVCGAIREWMKEMIDGEMEVFTPDAI